MRSRIFAVTVAAAAAVAVAACHHEPPELVQLDAAAPSSSSASTAPPASSSSDDAAAPTDAGEADGGQRATFRAFCGAAFSADESRMKDKCAPADFTLTQSMAKAAAGVCANDLVIAVGRQRAEFDAEMGRKCVQMLGLKQLAQSSESDTFYQHSPCDRMLKGLQPEGQPCRFSIECQDGLACVGYKIGVDGTCKKPPALKEACTLQPYGTLVNVAASAIHHPACAPGAYCDGSTCQARIQPGKSCSKSDACAPGLSCVMGKCGLRPGVGTACAGPGDCAYGLWCERGGDAGAGKCAAKRAEGQDCTVREACRGRCDFPPKPDGHTPGKCAAVCGSG
ncbi:MAG TPA: Dickkopf N-terminal cysteine-rich domain-containing protein [Polyangiaceae bacterium]|jgi:hypothetical protein